MVDVQGLCKAFSGKTVLDKVDLRVEAGEVHGLLGRNGAGKTTLLRLLLGLLPREAGTIRLFGQEVTGHLQAILLRVGSLIETPGFYPNLTAEENLKLFAPVHARHPHVVADALGWVGLGAGTKPVGKFSLGMKQRLGIARALVGDPQLVILDEPTNGLDPQGIHEVRTLIQRLSREHGRTVLVSSHLLSEVEQVAHSVTILDGGRALDRVVLADFQRDAPSELHLVVDRPTEAAALLGRLWPQAGVQLAQDRLVVRTPSALEPVHPAAANRALVEAGFAVSSLTNRRRTLEAHFLEVTRRPLP